jgi:hypothetical protein
MLRHYASKMEAVKMSETSAIQPKPTSTRLHLPVTEFTLVLNCFELFYKLIRTTASK